MSDIAVGAVCSLSARHRDEEPLFSLNDLNIVYQKLIVQRNGNDRFHPPILCNFPYSYVGYRHTSIPRDSEKFGIRAMAPQIPESYVLL